MSSTDTAMSSVNTAQPKEQDKGSRLSQMYNGTGNFPFVAKRRLWYQILIAIFVLCIATIGFRGFNLGIDFEGGTRISMPPSANVQQDAVERVFTEATGVAPNAVQTVGSGDSQVIEINSERLSEDQIRQARAALFEEFKPVNAQGQASEDAVNDSTVSESWGSSITKRMLLALGVFVLAVFAYIGLRMERDMAISAIIGVLIDLTVVSGIYALLGLDVSPATVIGLLTILAYSLYDTVVVFDKVQENTAGLFDSNRATYGEQVNLAINQTVMRSINTSIFSLVPIAALLVIAVWLMGVGTLKDLALVQFIGVICGTFNSIFFAAPMLVSLKMRQQKYREHDDRVLQARERVAAGEEPAEDSEEEPRAGTRTVVSPNAGLGAQRKQQPDTSGLDTSGVSWRPGM
ncbi:protein translocase subunit SecF [Corynebacterium urealyticum]|uniref:protein translocase subunit SecF n=1 Tax=Corynebacterium urealyticum TaxID=43771 RepID=UPI0002B3FB8B|nr:protein-export membrane protein SecF [Corynebacterium urealyticum DSM 7111]QQB08165.1 protein translocase subunit SecF [Corynebacterium urealyticum]